MLGRMGWGGATSRLLGMRGGRPTPVLVGRELGSRGPLGSSEVGILLGTRGLPLPSNGFLMLAAPR